MTGYELTGDTPFLGLLLLLLSPPDLFIMKGGTTKSSLFIGPLSDRKFCFYRP